VAVKERRTVAEKKDDRIEDLKDQLMNSCLSAAEISTIKDKIQFLQNLEK
jgi:hypothetical protein